MYVRLLHVKGWRFHDYIRQYNEHMKARGANRFSIGLARVIGPVLFCALGGCWEKIEYTGPDPAAAAESQPPAVTVAPAEQPMAPSSDVDVAANQSEEPVSDLTVSNEFPSAEPPAKDVAAVPATAEVLRTPERTPTDESPSSTPPVSSKAILETTAASPSVTPQDDPKPTNTRRAAWELGSKLSIVALANDRGITEHIPTWAKEASAAAAVLGVKLARLPDQPDTSDPNELASKQVLNYLFVQGQELGRVLATRYGPDHAALLEVAVKSNLLVLLYQPGSSTAETIASALSQAAPRANLPAELWQPLVDLLKKQASLADVRVAVRKFHADVDQYLATSTGSDVR
jgi:hypothetical protein